MGETPMTHKDRMRIRQYREQLRAADRSPYARWLLMMLRIGSDLRRRNFG